MSLASRRYGLAILLLLTPLRSGLEGQTLRGRVLVAGDTVGVDGVTISLRAQSGETLVQVQGADNGLFQLPVPAPGHYTLNASRIGFSSFIGELLVGENEMVEVEIRMTQEAIPLDPLVVTARRQIRQGTLDEFYDRMERNRRRGVGTFITREEVDNSPSASTTLLLATTPVLYLEPTGYSGWNVRMRAKGDYCTPEYYLDGMLTSWERLPPMEDIEGVEIYRTGQGERIDGYWPSECGTVFLWRRTDWGNPFSWKRLFIAGGFVSAAAVIGLLF